MAENEPRPPREIDLIILRNQRAIMRGLLSLRSVDEQSLLTQGKETYEYLKRFDALGKSK